MGRRRPAAGMGAVKRSFGGARDLPVLYAPSGEPAPRAAMSARHMTIEINPESRRKITVGCIPEAQRSLLDRYRTWPRFHRGVRKPGLPLLKNLSRYRRCVLVAGCQRS